MKDKKTTKIAAKIKKTEEEVTAIVAELDRLTRDQQKLWTKHIKKTAKVKKLRALLETPSTAA